jgi:hypothetical protein
MGKYTSIVIGAIVALLGLWGIIGWWCDFLTVLKGSVPAMLIFGGAIAVIAGLSEIKDEAAAKKTEEKKA